MKTFKPLKIVFLGKLAIAVLALLIIFQQILQLNYVINTKVYLPDRENDPLKQKELNLYNFDIESGSSVNRNSVKYLVNTESCKLQDLNPFDPLQMKHFQFNLKEPNCLNSLSPMELVNNQLKLRDDVRDNLLNQSESANGVYLKCCLREISRVQPDSENYAKYDEKSEWTANISKCYIIEDPSKGIITAAEFVITSCVYHLKANHKKYGNRMRTYLAQVHPPENHSAQTKAKTNIWKEKLKAATNSSPSNSKGKNTTDLNNNDFHPPNVLIIGIDATSRLHSVRSIPKTREFLKRNDFIEMNGYTKVGDNTFPNVMAFLTGMEVEQKSYPFWPNISVTVDDCPFIWKNFSANQYITAFIEDYIEQSMFGFGKLGFVQQPTDYYTRPLLNHFEFHGRINHHPHRCISGKTEANFVLEYIQNFIKRMNRVDLSSNLPTTTNNQTIEKRNKAPTLTYPYFMTTWLGSIGHDDFNGLRQADEDFYKFVTDILSSNPISDQYNNNTNSNNHKVNDENTVIILLGDHGYRFDVGRDTASGYFENSLPMFFIRIPSSLKSAQPQWYNNLVVNSNRLTTPLDLHKTLENIVSLSNPDPVVLTQVPITSTRKTQAFEENEEADKDKDNDTKVYSLFEEIPQNRSCKSARIPKTYCRCNIQAYGEDINVKLLSPRYGEALAGWINELLRGRGLSDICLPVSFATYEYVRQLYFTEENGTKTEETEGIENNDENKKVIFSNSPSKYFLIGAYILPGTGLFEATIKISSEFSKNIDFVGNVSRINSYGRYKGEYNCVDKSEDRAYCACQRQPKHQLLDFAFR